jgi:hypothetical protein
VTGVPACKTGPVKIRKLDRIPVTAMLAELCRAGQDNDFPLTNRRRQQLKNIDNNLDNDDCDFYPIRFRVICCMLLDG